MGAWASQQSSVLPDKDGEREVLERQVKDVEKRFEGTKDEDVPVPDFWGGLRVLPEMVEFWQGRDSRLHDRYKYTLVGKGEGGDAGEGWRVERLSP